MWLLAAEVRDSARALLAIGVIASDGGRPSQGEQQLSPVPLGANAKHIAQDRESMRKQLSKTTMNPA